MTVQAAHEPLWRPLEILAALGASARRGALGEITGISIDTRTLRKGDLFFAIKGDKLDGHGFVRDALEKGAAGAVIDEAHAQEFLHVEPLLIVHDVLAAMIAAGRAARARTGAKIVAVTGSVGKTSTKEALRHALGAQGLTHASAQSYNNHWGVPLSLARMPRDCDFGIFEIGMSAAGEILPLVAMVRPHVAIVTAIAPVHLEFFPSVDAIADAKAEIFSALEPGGIAIINRDSPYFDRLAAHAAASPAGRIVSFGEHEKADIRLTQAIVKPALSIVEAEVFGTPAAYRLGTPGKHLVLNSLAVLGAVHALGADLALAALSLGQLEAAPGRGARSTHVIGRGTFLLIDESYNANPASMSAALLSLAQAPVGHRGRRIAVIADMLELGQEAAALHAALAKERAIGEIDLVFTAGPLAKNIYDALPPERRARYAETVDALAPAVIEAIEPGDTVMIKGSNSTGISRIVAALKKKYPVAEPVEA